jgi:predicted ATP-grasp superfamily ATP-dependent carboligase
LAASASRAGHPVHVLDLFADLDTYQYARSVGLAGDCQRGFEPERLESAVGRLLATENIAGIVTGSGFEDRPELLETIGRGRPLMGNGPETVRAVKDPVVFFGWLRRLGIPHPEISDRTPADSTGWLIKRIGGAGGGHIRSLGNNEACPDGCYLQRYVDGRAYSVVFLANGREAALVGFSQLWQARDFAGSPFKYGGAMAWRRPEKCLRGQVEEAVQAVVESLGLQGLCGMDFIVDCNGGWCVLEVNPRPPATFELHEHPAGLFSDHVLACAGRLPRTRCSNTPTLTAQGVLYAPRLVTLAKGIVWPEWTSDRPSPGTRIQAREPICTVHARGGDEGAVRRLVVERLALVESRLGIFAEAA